jgi:hypothetical protein
LAEQSIVWTALPNGTTDGGKTLVLSVHASPRLSYTTKNPKLVKMPEYVALSDYPDFLDWASHDITFTVRLGSHPPFEAAPRSARRADLWQAVFTPSARVRPYSWEKVWIDPAEHRLQSYPVSRLRAFVSGMYGTVAHQSPLDWPALEVLGRAGFSEVPAAAGAFGTFVPGGSLGEVLASIDHLYDRRVGAIPPEAATTPAQEIAMAGVFLAPFQMPLTEQTKAEAKFRPHPQPPSFEFHQAVSLLCNHPPLARLLGLVFDLEFPRPAGLPPTYPVSVEASWRPHIKTSNLSPKTITTGLPFRPAERPTAPELAGGYARVGGPEYTVVEVDVDGATTKAVNLAESTRNALAHRAADTPSSYALPSLRSAGLSLARGGNAYALGLRLLSANEVNTQLQSNQPPVLYAEDVTRGYRVDVWDDFSNAWHTLCARVAAPGTGGYLVGSPPTAVPVPPGDEGWIQLGTTSAPGSPNPTGPSGDQKIPETLFRWAGWSLVAPRPGAHLPDNSSSGLATNEQSATDAGFPVSISYAAAPGSLPVLRFGHRYRFQARAVDLAGNSVAMRPKAKPAPLVSTSPVPYLRFEPVASPLLLFKAPRTPGEHLELLVIRSNYDVPDSDPSIGTCERHVVPPPVAEELAEAHGRLDGLDGRPDPSKYSLLVKRASATYNDASVAAANGGVRDRGTLNQFYFGTDQLTVPYLPDPLGRGAAFAGLPGAPLSLKPLQVPFFGHTSNWPDARSFRLVLRPGSKGPEQPSAANSWALSVSLPKGIIWTARMSCFLEAADVELMGLWSWLSVMPLTSKQRAELFDLAVWGRHWMFTPFREVTLVHAVRQPLIAPHFGLLAVERDLGATYASLSDPYVTVDHRSSVRLDVLANWQEPFDDGRNPAGSVELSGRSRVGELQLDYNPVLRKAAFKAMRHEFGDTKHRKVYYHAVATTRFLEYFAETREVMMAGENPVVVSPLGFAEGATTVTGAGVSSKVVRVSGPAPTIVYREGVDYIEDDAKGTIARLVGGAIADGEKVDVRYVPPPTTRSSLEHPVAPAGPKGLLRSVPSSARPAKPDVRYLLPAFAWSSGPASGGGIYSQRSGNTLRIYLGRPWWSSGEGELLGVVLVTRADVGIEPQLQPLFSRAGADPLWLTGSVGSVLHLGQFPLAVATGQGIVLAEQYTERDGMADVAGHEVSFDPVHGLWFADVTIDVGASYWPFVRLGLVRYQTSSLRTAEVSAVVQTDFAQLAPNRLATLSFPDTDEVAITVTGPGVAGLPSQQLPLSMRAFVEGQRPGVSDPDLQWEPASPDVAGGTALTPDRAGADLVWHGTVKLPVARGSKPMRIRLQEFELIPVDNPGALAVQLGARVTYLDTLLI